MICTSSHISLIAKMAHELEPNVPAELLAEELFKQNLIAEATEMGKEWVVPTFAYDSSIRVASFLPVQKIEALLEFQEACEKAPLMWNDEGSAKELTELLMRYEIKKLEGYGCTFTHSMKQLANRLNPLDFPPIVKPTQILKNQDERDRGIE